MYRYFEATLRGRARLDADQSDVAGALMHVAQKCAAVLGQRHASKQKLKARRLNPFQRDAL
jgi:hypothetical protein